MRAMAVARGDKDGVSGVTKCVKVETVPEGLETSVVEQAIKTHFGRVGKVEAVEVMGGGVVLVTFR